MNTTQTKRQNRIIKTIGMMNETLAESPTNAIAVCQLEFATRASVDLALENLQRPEAQIMDMAANVHGLMDTISLQVKEQKPIACREGCHWCCYQHATVAIPEVFAIVEYLKRHGLLEQVRPKIMAAYEKTKHLENSYDYVAAQVLCPLNEDGKCLVYDVRPLSCRQLFSTDANYCADTYSKNIDIEEGGGVFILPLSIFIWTNIILALAANKLESGGVGLVEGLHAALKTNPRRTLRQWLRGKRLFSEAIALETKRATCREIVESMAGLKAKLADYLTAE